LLTRKEPSDETQRALKIFLGIFIIWTGLKLCWASLNGTHLQILGQLGLTVLALSLGHATGGLLRIQTGLNKLGSFARSVLTPTSKAAPANTSDVFLACAVVFAINPLGIYGALLEGVQGSWEVLAIKAVMDGLSALAFARMLGWPVLLSVIPVLTVQGTLTLVARVLAERVLTLPMIEAIGAAGGMLVFSVCLVVFPVKKIRLADYLPAFIYAPLLAWWLR
jgi:uncharacterized membrane protein YqgA involved in biofilm formation